MINEVFIAEKKESVNYLPLPKDVYQVELLDVNLENTVSYDTRNKPDAEKIYEKTLSFQFTLLEGSENGKSLRGRNIWANLIPSYLYISSKNGKNKLYKIVEALIQRELTKEEEAEGITDKKLNSLIGKQCRISVENVTKGDKTYDRINDWFKINSGLPLLSAEEKEKARVKDKTEEPQETYTDRGIQFNDGSDQRIEISDNIDISQIPF